MEELSGRNISIPVLKDIQNVKIHLEMLRTNFEKYENVLKRKVKEYIIKDINIENSPSYKDIEIISNDYGFFKKIDNKNNLKFEYKYKNNEDKITINYNDLWKGIKSYFEKIYYYFKIISITRKFDKKYKKMIFIDENSIYNYLNKLYSDF